MNNPDPSVANRRAAIRWGSLVVGMLTLQVILGVVAITLATSDQSSAVIPDYYNKALAWDQQRAQREASQSLKWQLEFVETKFGKMGSGLLINIKNDQNQPVPIQSGSVQLYHHARASEVIVAPITKADAGIIELAGCFPRRGLWQVEIDVVDRDGNRFVESRRMDIVGNSQSGGT